MDNPKISIIVPIFNIEKFLPRCIESILSQTFIDFELILVNDGSHDSSGEICDNYARLDNRVRVFHNNNAGAGASRKFGVQQARGEWIEFVDGDDTIPVDSLEKLYSIAQNGIYDIVIGTVNLNYNSIYSHDITGEVKRDDYIMALLLNKTNTGPVAKLYKSNLYKSIEWQTPKEITNNEDMLMLIALAVNVNLVFISNDVLAYNYIYRNGSASKSVVMPLDNWIKLFDLIKLLLHNLKSQKINDAISIYEIRRLYLCNILRGQFVIEDSPILSELKQECTNIKLLDDDKSMWKTLLSIRKQKIAYILNSFSFTIKKQIKRILRLEAY